MLGIKHICCKMQYLPKYKDPNLSRVLLIRKDFNGIEIFHFLSDRKTSVQWIILTNILSLKFFT